MNSGHCPSKGLRVPLNGTFKGKQFFWGLIFFLMLTRKPKNKSLLNHDYTVHWIWENNVECELEFYTLR